MRLKKLQLTNFRSYQQQGFKIGVTTVLVGRNAAGKTNILEAIWLLATGESFRAEKIEEMVKWNEEVGHVEGEVKGINQEAIDKLKVTLTRGIVQGKRTLKRFYKVNEVGRRKVDFAGRLTAVIFRPEEINMITGTPGDRRAFLDRVLFQSDREYRRSLASYEKGLRRRNKLLTLIREGEAPRTSLVFWDQLLVKEGGIIHHKRQELIDYFNGQEKLEVKRWLRYEASIISENRLKQYQTEELVAGHTLVGPHRDDFKILSINGGGEGEGGVDVAIYGSRGQQRMAIVWLKKIELDYLTYVTKERPILLLDDIFSELDEEHDRLVMGLLGKQQTLITTTEIDGRFKGINELEIIEI